MCVCVCVCVCSKSPFMNADKRIHTYLYTPEHIQTHTNTTTHTPIPPRTNKQTNGRIKKQIHTLLHATPFYVSLEAYWKPFLTTHCTFMLGLS